jgi:HD-GYP domain-containing protein (c-di-GMP phosphodiesterase class II)
MSLLIVERGPGAGTRISLEEFPITIGRDASNSIVVDDTEVSRNHLRIKKRGRVYVVEDLESRNGSFVNGDKILNSIIKNGDKILIGTIEFLFMATEPNIQFADQIMDFDMVIDDDLGLSGPIELGEEPEVSNKFTPIRLTHQSMDYQFSKDPDAIKTIFEHHSDLIVVEDMAEASRSLLKSVGKILPSADRGALFIWSAPHRKLIPMATRQFSKNSVPFLLSQRSMEDVLARKQGVLLQADNPNSTQSGCSRLILPMIHHDIPICIIHVEMDNRKKTFDSKELDLLQGLLNRCAPSFESMLLRKEIDAWMVGMIETLIATIEAKDTYTQGHSERVSRYCMAIADQLKLTREVKRLLLVSALCHDVGKIGIPDEILKKASLLSSEEYEEMKLHPTIGADIVGHMPNAHRIISGVKYHHEKWDGTGYPEGLKGEDIPFFARIVGIADVFDAMISGRAYSGFMDEKTAVERLQEEAELFDPEILKAFVRAHECGSLTLKTGTGGNKVDEKVQFANKADNPDGSKVKLTPASDT